MALLVTVILQYQNSAAKEQARLQATLLRPAQFDGTTIQDENLKETSFDKQVLNQFAVSSEQAEALLEGGDVVFVDVREAAEHQMGSLPNSQHIRFPDIANNLQSYADKKLVLYCHNGNRSSETCANLAKLGVDCRFIAGGVEKWIVEGRDFSDKNVRGLSDLRAIPNYKNKDRLLSTDDFRSELAEQSVQIVDTRYPGDFATGHLPGAINIPLRAMPTDQLIASIDALENKPTVAACYDRRSCFMGQVLGYELAARGFDFRGRYTTPWEYFIPPAPKPHVQQWLAGQNLSMWQQMIDGLALGLGWVADRTHILLAIFALSLISRVLVLPIALKSERDQLVSRAAKDQFDRIKARLKHEPARKIRALQALNSKLGLTPMRNLTALLFLPVMLLGLSAVEKMAASNMGPLLWMQQMHLPDPSLVLPVLFCLLGGIYLHVAVAKNTRQRVVSWAVSFPLLMVLVWAISGAGMVYLNSSMVLLLAQRAYVVGLWEKTYNGVLMWIQNLKARYFLSGIRPLSHVAALGESGNKSLRLAVMKAAGIPVPDGVVLDTQTLQTYANLSPVQKEIFYQKIWKLIGQKPCAVRSSAADEDGEEQSFAGVFESVLHVEQNGLGWAIDSVLESFTTSRAASYAGTGSDRGNILIQQMVDAQYSGVLFTQDPTAPGAMLLEIVEGTADDLVSGRVTPQTLRFGRFTKENLSPDSPPIDVRALLALGDEIAEIFGTPQDIEWAYADGALYILQSRDITTLSKEARGGDPVSHHWQDLFERFANMAPDQVVLEQDEMSEVLPYPTPLSFSMMGDIWGAGGSVEQACAALGMRYQIPEEVPGHLVNVFGKIYSDRQLKEQSALQMGRGTIKHLNRQVGLFHAEFEEDFLPNYHRRLALIQALDVTRLDTAALIECLLENHRFFVDEVYVCAEMVNILASFTLARAQEAAQKQDVEISTALQGMVPFSPTALMAASAGMEADKRLEKLISDMGHRAIYDYELSIPRYSEAPEMLVNLAQAGDAMAFSRTDDKPRDVRFERAMEFQGLKERAKHEALKLLAEQRRFCLEIGMRLGIDEKVFHMTFDEIGTCTAGITKTLLERLEKRVQIREALKEHTPEQPELTLGDMERACIPGEQIRNVKDGQIGGNRVSGSGSVSGRIYHPTAEQTEKGEELVDFQEGDILVCTMLHPAWLPYVLRAGGVVSQVGGWLSHMAIVARERDIAMFVGCNGIAQLIHGKELEIDAHGGMSLVLCDELQVFEKAAS
ncbi:hypothetical protein GCM10007939_02270 [Amylibacter marinus]|uniref:Rhodanese domain-containing protein n=2 Tax=Amylibacter marinus TaxID=1475483 RepID=A0ABQ5VRW1_9RHOB|nr:hypothetical protein GCM10007939_02270 [Amylibacter marinus]